MTAKAFRDKILAFLSAPTTKTGWGKVELRGKIMELYADFLEEEQNRVPSENTGPSYDYKDFK